MYYRESMALWYWTGAGVLIRHAAIAYADALCIQQGSVRSGADDQEGAVILPEQVLPSGAATSMGVQQLRRIIDEKTRVSYLGELYGQAQTHALWGRLDRFRQWAKRLLRR